MIKLFVTGDVHIGKKYDRYPEVKNQLIESRFECLTRCVRQAEQEQCDFFVLTGDLFDSASTVSQRDVKRVVDILAGFGERVLVLPGNHDYYTGEEPVWKTFLAACGSCDNNIQLITQMRPLSFDVGEERIVFYPALCQSKLSPTNNLGWIQQEKLEQDCYHVGLAHGALEGLSPDMKNEYFLMTERELNEIPMDAWLLGHTHIPYPNVLKADQDVKGYSIFNPGTPEQTDLSNNTTGVCFVITLDKQGAQTQVMAHSYQSGVIRFYDLAVCAAAQDDLQQVLEKTILQIADRKTAVLRLTLSGVVKPEDYQSRREIYTSTFSNLITYEVDDEALCEQITKEKIRAEFAEIGFAAQLLEQLTDEPQELQMAYNLLKQCQQ